MTCNVADDYGFRRLRKIFYADKRDFNFDSSSVLNKLLKHALFHDCHRENPELCTVSLFQRIGLNFNVNFLKVFIPRFMRINC